jgi:hypothetical protein
MQPCVELKNIVLRHYGKFESGGQADTIKEIYSLEDGVVIIGNDPNEWFEDRDAIIACMNAGSSMDRVMFKLSNDVELPVRHTRIFHNENGAWKMVHLHVSIPVSNDMLGE